MVCSKMKLYLSANDCHATQIDQNDCHATLTTYTTLLAYTLNPIRSLPPLKMIDAIWSTTMKTIYDRHNRPQQSTELADIPLSKFKDRLKASQRYCVFESGNGIY